MFYSFLLRRRPAARSPASAPQRGAGAWVKVGDTPVSAGVDTGAAVVGDAAGVCVCCGAVVAFVAGLVVVPFCWLLFWSPGTGIHFAYRVMSPGMPSLKFHSCVPVPPSGFVAVTLSSVAVCPLV